jgi:hypothetical protein
MCACFVDLPHHPHPLHPKLCAPADRRQASTCHFSKTYKQQITPFYITYQYQGIEKEHFRRLPSVLKLDAGFFPGWKVVLERVLKSWETLGTWETLT